VRHVLAVDLGHLLSFERHGLQGRHRGHELLHADLAGGVAHIVARAGDGAAGAQDDDRLR
jgi:hypothetical protein